MTEQEVIKEYFDALAAFHADPGSVLSCNRSTESMAISKRYFSARDVLDEWALRPSASDALRRWGVAYKDAEQNTDIMIGHPTKKESEECGKRMEILGIAEQELFDKCYIGD